MSCRAIVVTKCSQNHKITLKCYEKVSMTCRKCETETRAKEKKRKRDYELDRSRQEKQRAYAAQLAELDDQIEHERRVRKIQAEDNDCQNALAQKKQDLANLKASARKPRNASLAPDPTTSVPKATMTGSKPDTKPGKHQSSGHKTNEEPDKSAGASSTVEEKLPKWEKGEANDDWDWQKKYEGEQNEALDSLMAMIGNLSRGLAHKHVQVCIQG
jgi:hypothetical protein